MSTAASTANIANVVYGDTPCGRAIATDRNAATNPNIVAAHPYPTIIADFKAPIESRKFPSTSSASSGGVVRSNKQSMSQLAENAAHSFLTESINFFAGPNTFVVDPAVLEDTAKHIITFIRGVYFILQKNEKHGGAGYDMNAPEQKMASALKLDQHTRENAANIPILGEAALGPKSTMPDTISKNMSSALRDFSEYLALNFIRPVMSIAMNQNTSQSANIVIPATLFQKQFNAIGKSLDFAKNKVK